MLLALHKVGRGSDAGAVERGVRWLEGMQSSDGGWAAFDVDNCRALVRDLPFCDFGEVIDPPSADVTAHAVEVLAELGRGAEDRARGAACSWLLDAQEADGSWFGRWGVNYVYGTGAVVPALDRRRGVRRTAQPIRRAVRWLEDVQNEDGGWGEDCRSYDERVVGRARREHRVADGVGAAGAAMPPASVLRMPLGRGVEWLVRSQRADGTWDEPQYTGTGFPGDFYINYHLYRLVFPVMALARCAR